MCIVYTPESIFLMVYFRDQMKNKSSNELRSLAGWERIALRLGQPPGQVYLVTGHSSAYTASLIIGCAAGQQIAVVDGAMRFNSYLISRIAAGLDLEPKDLLRRTHVTRSFTAFQTEAAITTRLPEFLQRRSCGVVLILGLLQTYYDEQIHVHESEHSLHRVLQTLHRVKAQNRHVLIAEADVENPPEGKEHLFGMIRAATEVTLSIQPVDAGYELIEQRSIEWDETTNPSPWSLTGTE
jgi:hypothetical protein